MCESKSFVKKEGRRVHIQGEKIFTNKTLVVSYGVNFFIDHHLGKKLILMLSFFNFNNEIFIIVLLEFQFLLIMLFFNREAING